MGLFSVLKLAVGRNLHRRFLDVGTAFLNAPRQESTEDIFLNIPTHLADLLIKLNPDYSQFRRPDGSLVMKALKAVYGERGAPLLWYVEMKKTLSELGYKCSTCEPCVFFRDSAHGKSFILLYVDDICITSPSVVELDRVH